MIYEQSIGAYLDRTASDAPAPGGGAAASLQLAQAAALIAMSARFSTGEKFAEYAPMVERVLATAKPLVGESLDAGDDDAAAFATVAHAYALPRDSDAAKEARTKQIQTALVGATKPPQRLLELGREIAGLGEELLGCANRNILSDIVAATASTRAAATIAQATLEINLAGVKDEAARSTIAEHIRGADSLIDFCDNLTKRIQDDISA
ncbi:cyclodeaminase/cyclohydrolase family protein [Arthrobacter castelli]|uniref:cyclodeaminase/cyclohydrolase family protein n=1 Tax=Arthrobacter castelli TaxID=271431 RepID=UPI00040E3E69|nr:cyclodeaminase/cyclohydrolase family protein [Arthrobacter castelli]